MAGLTSEREIQRAIVQLCRQLGGVVYSLSQGYRPGGRRHATTRQTKGLADLYVIFPAKKRVMWIEVKRPGQKPTPEQRRFAELNRLCGVMSVIGGLEELLQSLAALGFRFES